MSSGRCYMSDVRCQMSDVRCQMSYARCRIWDVVSYVTDVRHRDVFAWDMFSPIRGRVYLRKMRSFFYYSQISDLKVSYSKEVSAIGRCSLYRRFCFRETTLSDKCPSGIRVHFAEICAFENCLPLNDFYIILERCFLPELSSLEGVYVRQLQVSVLGECMP